MHSSSYYYIYPKPTLISLITYPLIGCIMKNQMSTNELNFQFMEDLDECLVNQVGDALYPSYNLNSFGSTISKLETVLNREINSSEKSRIMEPQSWRKEFAELTGVTDYEETNKRVRGFIRGIDFLIATTSLSPPISDNSFNKLFINPLCLKVIEQSSQTIIGPRYSPMQLLLSGKFNPEVIGLSWSSNTAYKNLCLVNTLRLTQSQYARVRVIELIYKFCDKKHVPNDISRLFRIS